MANSSSHQPSLYTKISRRNKWSRSVDVIILILLSSLVSYRAFHLNPNNFAWIIAFLCESTFCFVWFLVTNIKWNPVEYVTHPELLEQRVEEFPRVDMFVTTADPGKEPPEITVNTVLSLLALNYPAKKLACYVSDDAASPITFFSLKEASKFSMLWVPFCKKHNLHVRAPFRYFSNPATRPEGSEYSREFQRDWEAMKVEYEKLSRRLEETAKGSRVLYDEDDFAAFSSDVDPQNHAAIVKVIWENKGGVGDEREVPHLVYIAREKRPKQPHHYKAGAMNALVRVSGLMTNAPFMLNVDCDMYANNAEIVRQAMCLFFGTDKEKDSAFVQSPQLFYDNPESDLAVMHEFLGYGMVGIQGPFYQGSGCFHKRKIIYGLSPDDIEEGNPCSVTRGESLDEDKLLREFGHSKELTKSVTHSLEGKPNDGIVLTSSTEEALRVASSDYESGTAWGKKMGWLYGSTTEDINTGMSIHSRGWRTLYNSPDPPAFLGCCPPGGPTAMAQQQRWATGLLELLLGPNNPILATLQRKLEFQQCLAYLWILVWGLRSIPELCYSLLPAYCILSDHAFLPEGPFVCVPILLFVVYNMYSLWEYRKVGLSVRNWWSCQQFARIKATCAWLFSLSDIVLKFMGLSETVFVVTKKTISTAKDHEARDEDAARFVFDESPYFLPGTTILLVNLSALASVVVRLDSDKFSKGSSLWGIGDILCSIWVVMSYWPFLRGLFGKGKYGIPLSTICKATLLACLFVVLSKGNATFSM